MTTLKIQATHLRDAIRPVAALAATDAGAPPVLSQVHLWTDDGFLYASCTDRLVAGIERTWLDGAEPGFETCVNVTDLGNHLDLVAPRGSGYNPRLILEATPGGLVVQSEPYDTSHPSATFHLQAFDPASFPRVTDTIDRILAKAATATVDGDFDGPPRDLALYAQVIARFTTAQGSEPMRLHFTGDHRAAIVVSAGDSFVGIVMPASLAPRGTSRARGLSAPVSDKSGPNLWTELFGGDDE